MADSNSKKPMALLLLVVVAVLVVIMVSGGDAAFEGHDKLTTQVDCEGAKGTWAKAMVAVAEWKAVDGTEATCTDAGGTFTKAVPEVKDANTQEVTTPAADATCMKEAEAETCSAPDYTAITAEADCTDAKGTWVAGGDNDTPDDKSDDTKDSCTPWAAASN